MAVDINDTPNRVRYTATAGQTAFSVPFQFPASSDLKVYQNGTLKTLATHYTVTGAGASSGTVTLVSGAALSDDILIIRDLPVERIGDFPVSGPFDVESLNRQLDVQTMMVRDMETRIERRLLRQPVTDLPETLSDIPAKTARANLYLGFDANGQPKTDVPNAAVLADYGERIDDLETISGSLPAVGTVAANIGSVNTVATNIGSVNSAATNITDIRNFGDVYLGPKTANPTVRNNNTALQPGDLYFNTVANRLRIYDDGVWSETGADGATTAALVSYRAGKFGTVAQTTVQEDLDRKQQAIVAQRGGVIAIVFDDGYRSNYLNAMPIFQKYGMAATLFLEVEAVALNYNSNPDYPVVNADEMRALVRAGWEIANHPALVLTDTEATMVSKARAENLLIREYLTGEKIAPNAQAGTLTYPEFSDYTIDGIAYRGGARNATSDKAYRYLYDKVRSINGPESIRGDHLYAFGVGSERTTQMSAFTIDTSGVPLTQILPFIKSVSQTGSTAILYGHDTPVTAPATVAAPYILASELEQVLKLCHDLGVAVVPLRNLFQGNALHDPRFDNSSGSFAARAGDSAGFDTTVTMNGGARTVKLFSVTPVSNINTRYVTPSFVAEPFCRYRIRTRYKIDTDLDILGTGNRNHGLQLQLSSLEANTVGDSTGFHSLSDVALNDTSAVIRLPYAATGGAWEENEVILVNGAGPMAQLQYAMFNAGGTVWIGNIIIEKLDSIIQVPLSGQNTFNTTGSRRIYLPAFGGSVPRGWTWEVSFKVPTLTFSVTYDYAAKEPSWFTPTTGTTAFVLDGASGAFAGQTGNVATWNGSAWTFAALAAGTIFKANNWDGVSNRYGRVLFPKVYEISSVAIFTDQAYFDYTTSNVYNSSGTRSDTFTWYARPVPLNRS